MSNNVHTTQVVDINQNYLVTYLRPDGREQMSTIPGLTLRRDVANGGFYMNSLYPKCEILAFETTHVPSWGSVTNDGRWHSD